MQAAAHHSVSAIKELGVTITDICNIATAIAATIEAQCAACFGLTAGSVRIRLWQSEPAQKSEAMPLRSQSP
jgi:hypothetical protein